MEEDLSTTVEVSIILPCLNEEQAVGQVIDEAWRGLENADVEGEIVVVDNGSTDRSAAIADRWLADPTAQAAYGHLFQALVMEP